MYQSHLSEQGRGFRHTTCPVVYAQRYLVDFDLVSCSASGWTVPTTDNNANLILYSMAMSRTSKAAKCSFISWQVNAQPTAYWKVLLTSTLRYQLEACIVWQCQQRTECNREWPCGSYTSHSYLVISFPDLY